MEKPNRYFAISSFWILDEHQLALVNLSAQEIARFQFFRRQLALLSAADRAVTEIVVDAQPVLWFGWDQQLQERMSEEISADEWQAKVDARPEGYEEPETAYVHVTSHGLHFSCVTESDNAHTSTITWAALEAT